MHALLPRPLAELQLLHPTRQRPFLHRPLVTPPPPFFYKPIRPVHGTAPLCTSPRPPHCRPKRGVLSPLQQPHQHSLPTYPHHSPRHQRRRPYSTPVPMHTLLLGDPYYYYHSSSSSTSSTSSSSGSTPHTLQWQQFAVCRQWSMEWSGRFQLGSFVS